VAVAAVVSAVVVAAATVGATDNRNRPDQSLGSTFAPAPAVRVSVYARTHAQSVAADSSGQVQPRVSAALNGRVCSAS
jgi:hypothetical protein